MSGRRVDQLRTPKPGYDLAKIMARKVCPERSERAGRDVIVGFETDELARAEDVKRRALGKAVDRDCPAWMCPRRVRRLVKALSYGKRNPPHSRASSLRSRRYRRKITGAVLRLIAETAIPVKVFTLLSQDWVIAAADLTPDGIRKIRKRVCNHLDRLRPYIGEGFVIAGFDGKYDDALKAYVIHLHGIVAGDYIGAFDRVLRGRRAYRPTDYIARPLRIGKLKEAPKQASYIIKGFWDACDSEQALGKGITPRRMRRVPEPYGTHYLSVLADLTITETLITKHLAINNGRFIVQM